MRQVKPDRHVPCYPDPVTEWKSGLPAAFAQHQAEMRAREKIDWKALLDEAEREQRERHFRQRGVFRRFWAWLTGLR